jgi:H2-forming N5,N10-methylenetetrahydromethanopterin dehydrogenase-like enzyme
MTRTDGDPDPADPVLARRRQMARAAELAQRAGYALFGLAVVLFVVGFAVGLTAALVTAILVSLGVGSVLRAPAIVVGYAVKAADREDRERGLGR